uniref:Uncharacterized protein n=1 Tax=Klebsiella pneumoniae TaxID=573 RepID=A0A8B0SV83_KLEPN|nr:hypothetical protein [Klebsiella pneumoniae]
MIFQTKEQIFLNKKRENAEVIKVTFSMSFFLIDMSLSISYKIRPVSFISLCQRKHIDF